jgi:Arc/MetJ-type ribon-helix-helix transcriptional regulator
MKSNVSKSSITLPPGELELVERLRKRLGARSKVEVVRRGLRLLQESTDRAALRDAYAHAARQVRGVAAEETEALDWLAAENLERE